MRHIFLLSAGSATRICAAFPGSSVTPRRSSLLVALKSDSCVYVNKGCSLDERNSPLLIVCIYVDDGLVISNSEKLLSACITHLKQKFELTVQQPTTFVGIQIERDRKKQTILMHQKAYLRRVLERFEMSNATPMHTPLEANRKIRKSGEDSVESKQVDSHIVKRSARSCTQQSPRDRI